MVYAYTFCVGYFNFNLTIIDRKKVGHVQNCMASIFSNKAGKTSTSSRKDKGNA